MIAPSGNIRRDERPMARFLPVVAIHSVQTMRVWVGGCE